MACPNNDGVIRHGSSGALVVGLHVLGGPIGEPVAALPRWTSPTRGGPPYLGTSLTPNSETLNPSLSRMRREARFDRKTVARRHDRPRSSKANAVTRAAPSLA